MSDLILKFPQIDHPWDKVLEQVRALIGNGHTVWQKWTCAGCKVRWMAEERDSFKDRRRCNDCGHITDIKAQGCNFAVLMKGPATTKQFLEQLERDRRPQ